MTYQVNCRFFSGYKPCSKNNLCSPDCPSREEALVSILLVHLGAMGAVLRSTALLKMIKRKYPQSIITWVTEDHSKPLLQNNPLIHRVLGLNTRDLLILESLRFDIGFFADKSLEVEGIRKKARPLENFGFGINGLQGAVVPLNDKAGELWEIGLNNHKKFFENKKTELQLMAEAFELPFAREDYELVLTEAEQSVAHQRRQIWSLGEKTKVIGLNTGTSGVLPYKTLPVSFWRKLIQSYEAAFFLQRVPQKQFVLLGGPEEESRHQEILEGLSTKEASKVILSPVDRGLRDGLCSIAATDIIVSGDSLGMHMGIALKKFVVAWFGPTCSHEIDLYDRGIKIKTSLSCSPCWKRSCRESLPCNQTADISDFHKAINEGLCEQVSLQENLDSAASL